MKKVLFTVSVILLALISSSCKKDKETTAQKLQHNWTIVSEVDNSHDASGDNINTITAASGDYVNFSSNGTVTSQFNGFTSTAAYSLISDTQISIDGETFTIKVLSGSQLVLYIKDDTSATEYDETTLNLKR
jgi:ABC-type oligopeptide transport system substrate-binding subunit